MPRGRAPGAGGGGEGGGGRGNNPIRKPFVEVRTMHFKRKHVGCGYQPIGGMFLKAAIIRCDPPPPPPPLPSLAPLHVCAGPHHRCCCCRHLRVAMRNCPCGKQPQWATLLWGLLKAAQRTTGLAGPSRGVGMQWLSLVQAPPPAPLPRGYNLS